MARTNRTPKKESKAAATKATPKRIRKRPPKKPPGTLKRRSRPDWGPAFLVALADTGCIRYASKFVGVAHSTVYLRRDSDEVFARKIADAIVDSKEALLVEARRRAHKGVTRPQYYQGKVCGLMREYSDNLLMFLIKQADPSFRESVKVLEAGHDGGPKPGTKALNVLDRIAEYTAQFLALSAGPEGGAIAGDDRLESVHPVEANGEASGVSGA